MSQLSARSLGAVVNDNNSLAAESVSTAHVESFALPPANQDACSPAVDPKLAAQLGRFHLHLVDHPRILVCTRIDCTHRLAIPPFFKDVIAHLKKSHMHAMVESSKKALKDLLERLDLEHPATVTINKDLLPVPIIKELDINYQGRHCNMCSYSIMARSSMNNHSRRYLYVSNPSLEPTPPPAILTTAMDADKLDDVTKAKVNAFIKKDQERMQEAGLVQPGIQPAVVSGNVTPWARQLNWHRYWAGKPVVAIGMLGRIPEDWDGAHCDIAHWIFVVAKDVVATWMNRLLKAGRQVQQTFHAYSDAPSKPYDLSPPTVKKRADLWAWLLALLFHIYFDGGSLDYFGKDDPEDHIGVNEEIYSALLDLREQYNTIINVGLDIYKDPAVVAKTSALLLELSHSLVTQEPEEYGQIEKLALVRMFLHLCVSRDGTPKPVSTSTSEIASLEFCLRAVLHEHLLHPEDGALQGMSAPETSAAVIQTLKRYVHHDSSSASSHLQSLHRFGEALAHDDGSSFKFRWSKDLSRVMFGLEEIAVERLQELMHGAQQQAEKLLTQLRLLAEEKDIHIMDLSRITDNHCNMQPGFNFARACLEPPVLPSILCRAVAGGAPAAQPLMDPYSDELEFDTNAARSYFAIHNEFTKLLAVLIELGSGLPARGTELLQLQHTNTLSGPRNLFVHDGRLFTALPSNKGTGRQKIIPRFLPHEVGCLVVLYVCQVVPFVHLLYNSVVKPREASAMLLVDHAGQPWDTNTISKMLQGLCKQYISSTSGGLTMRTWRQLAVSIDRTLIRPRKADAEDTEDHVHDLQAGHSTNTAEQHYGLDASMLYQLNQQSMSAMLEQSRGNNHVICCETAARFPSGGCTMHQAKAGAHASISGTGPSSSRSYCWCDWSTFSNAASCSPHCT
ncbi:uncharacterized protein UTRI_05403 [Ustilago trichophora]|uniref:Uncharacterized protein n=1 Tax=Ustilago trichophora TaxID=86804 RepID=A0A5C3EJA3_9BASI|nr:uncharacterized protein UTRI_05403 [Ustilago trichophora]